MGNVHYSLRITRWEGLSVGEGISAEPSPELRGTVLHPDNIQNSLHTTEKGLRIKPYLDLKRMSNSGLFGCYYGFRAVIVQFF